MASIHRPSSSVMMRACLFLLLAFGPQQISALAQSADEAALSALVRQYFATYAKEEIDAATRLWSEQSPEHAAARSTLEKFFAAYDRIEIREVKIRRLHVEGERASALASVELRAVSAKSRERAADVERMSRALGFVKEAGQWKVWRDVTGEADLADELVALKTAEERAARLAQESELRTAELWRALLARGGTLRTQGKYAEALSIYDLAQKVAEALDDKAGVTRALLFKGIVHYRQGRYDVSMEHLQRSMKLRESLDDKAGVAETLYHIGLVHYLRSDYKVALDYYQQSLSLNESLGRSDQTDQALTGMGVVHYRQGNYDLALGYYRKALALREKMGNKLTIGYAMSNIGGVYQVLGNLGLALDYHRKALAAFEALGAKPDAVSTLNNIGLLYFQQGNYELALDYYEKTVPLARAQGQQLELAVALSRVGNVLRAQGQYERALENFRQSLDISERVGNKQQLIISLQDIGEVYDAQGDYARGLEYYQKALGVAREIDAKYLVSSSLINVGRIHNSTGNHAKALEAAEEAVSVARQMGNADTLRSALTAVGMAQLGLRRLNLARRAFEEAVAAAESLRTQAAGGERAHQRYFERMISPYYRLVELLVAQGNVDEALAYAERGKARVLLDVLRSGRVDVTKAMTAAEREQERSLRSALATINAQISSEERRTKPDPALVAQLKERLERARRDHEDFQTRLYAAHPELKAHRGEAPTFTLEQGSELLTDARTALLEYVVTPDAAYLFVLTAEARDASKTKPLLKVYNLKATRADLSARVQSLRGRIANNDLEFSALSAELHNLLVAPAKAQLQGKTRLVIVPDDVLWETPFQALRPAGGKYLIQTASISYAPSLTVLREMTGARSERANGGTLLAMGNPQLAGETITRSKNVPMSTRLEPLPEAERLVKSLAQIYGAGASRIYTGAAAREEVLKAEAGRARVLQLATHGILDDSSPMYSHVVLSQGEGSLEDGLLEAWEVMSLDLKADLVVLSACETARGRFGAGEGVIGMTWALFVAGSPATVVSQWKVESSSTTELMLELHRNLRGGAGKSEAMRRAALKLIADKRYEHPFYWAGFIVVGDGD